MQITLLLPQTLVMWEVTDATDSSWLLNELPGDGLLIVSLGVSSWIVHRATANVS